MKILNRFKRTVKILSIDGGGVRGYIPVLILEALAALLREKGKPDDFSSHFDIIAGTSSGSLTALALTIPETSEEDPSVLLRKPKYSISDIVNIYETRSTDIFPLLPLSGLQFIKQAFREKYDDEGFEKVLEDIFGSNTVDDSLTDILISSYDLKSDSPVMIKKSHQNALGENFFMKDVARGSSAAPTYFEPHIMKSLSGKTEYCLVDGAMAANNPSLCAYTEARSLFPGAKNFIIFSVGTGKIPHHWDYMNARNWGFLDWISPQNGSPLYSIMKGAQEQCLDSQITIIPGVKYYRINPVLGKRNSNIDNASPQNMKQLRATAEKSIEENMKLLKKIADML